MKQKVKETGQFGQNIVLSNKEHKTAQNVIYCPCESKQIDKNDIKHNIICRRL